MLLLIHVVQYYHAGEQKMPREKRNKELTSFEMVISFVSLVTGHPLLFIIAVLHHVDDHLSVLTRPRHCSIAALFREMPHYNYPKGTKKEKNLLQNIRTHTYISL